MIKAKIRVYLGGRKTPFSSGYGPVFNFIPEMKKSGVIHLISSDKLYPGQEGEAEITFLNREFLGEHFSIGTKFTFGEGREPLGEGEVQKILS
ncbi:MAG TPA: hypothetical protein VF629_06300 [Hymenobacter sp.]